MPKPKTPYAKQAVLDVLKLEPQASVAQIAVSAGIGRSTASKLLTQLQSEQAVRRTAGGRDGKRRLPDVWSLADKKPAAAGAKPKRGAGRGPTAGNADRLTAGGLDPLVLAYLKENADSGPHGPSAVAKALQRSSGAVSNCLERLTKDKKTKRVTDKPRRYSLAA